MILRRKRDRDRRHDQQHRSSPYRSITTRLVLFMSIETLVVGILVVLGVIIGSRHELAEQGLTGKSSLIEGLRGGLQVIDVRKAITLIVVFIIVNVISAGCAGWYYSKREIKPLQQALRLQRHFVADASHELRTPLAVISMRVDVLEQRLRRGDDGSSAFEQLRGDIDRMNDIITDLLSAARGSLDAQSQPILPLINDAVAAIEPLARSRAVTVNTDITTNITTNPDRRDDENQITVTVDGTGLTRCLVAVLDNAVAHSPINGSIEISLARETRGKGRNRAAFAVISIRDHGTGMSGDPEQWFRRFARDDHGTAHQGYGLGLALARQTVSRYGGTIHVQSSTPQGTVMVVSIPIDVQRPDAKDRDNTGHTGRSGSPINQTHPCA
ncbi:MULTISPECIES: sensor histidine kinase [Bifidobacterium]|jgi:signal transduction histidine kinase|uniref:sensor histidine kinase n=1 Tax=Bifidobacterium TaxID=1678 RepID=UPI002357313E|nr:HAMP domain-containing sensor histidine kinase [Bifidobacterium tibiigranuli]MCI1211991.1 HAMP domain-containing histidine kinase [Bifidobacterium tibiigranuli]MCI1221743.1 HAMP domain-containing histidine kinase [Bifidobacterium tibiigranuli]MCI1232587.1 HAMP domain-containing histidine kinase [Bifidobacterium tibiigranuli]MCI1253915.1 HAMP domain-containing histidine kinase [Bifidobacterium tibiigranuli]